MDNNEYFVLLYYFDIKQQTLKFVKILVCKQEDTMEILHIYIENNIKLLLLNTNNDCTELLVEIEKMKNNNFNDDIFTIFTCCYLDYHSLSMFESQINSQCKLQQKNENELFQICFFL